MEKTFGRGVHAIRRLTLDVMGGEFLAILGPSGSGKTTLLNLLAGIDLPTAGSVVVGDREISSASDAVRAAVRLHKVGYVLQSFGLLPELTAAENVELPAVLMRTPGRRRRARTNELLSAVGLTERAFHRPTELSGGEQQRVAIARALYFEPLILLADEPTGNLDRPSARHIADLLQQVHASGTTVVLATHDQSIAARAQRVVFMRDGAIVGELRLTKSSVRRNAAALNRWATQLSDD